MRTRHWLTLALLFVSTASTAEVPGRLAYQGRLLKPDGSPEAGSKSFTFFYPDTVAVANLPDNALGSQAAVVPVQIFP